MVTDIAQINIELLDAGYTIDELDEDLAKMDEYGREKVVEKMLEMGTDYDGEYTFLGAEGNQYHYSSSNNDGSNSEHNIPSIGEEK